MKLRYFMLPILILTLIVFTLDNEKNIVNKQLVFENSNINYPFFNNNKIDTYINNYLNDYKTSNKNILIDYDYYNINNKYYLTFYKYIFDNNLINNSTTSFIIDTSKETINKNNTIKYEYNFISNKKIDDSKKLVALTFDDGPNYNTNKVLDILNKYNVKATFFVLGSEIKNNEYILQKTKDSNMEIGNHTFNHLLLTKYSKDKIKDEIDNTSDLIFEVAGIKPNLLRPSYGSFNKKIKSVANNPIIIWDIDTLDWKYHNSKKITNRVINKVQDGDIILMHDIYSATANSLNSIIPILQDMGYEFVTVTELFYYKGISLENGKVYGAAR